MKKQSKSLIVKISNDLVQAPLPLSCLASKLYLSLASRIKKDDPDFYAITFSMRELIQEISSEKSKDSYEHIYQAAEELCRCVIRFENEERTLITGMLNTFEHVKATNMITLKFHPAMKPFLLFLQENYTWFLVKYCLGLQSKYSIRIYQLMKQFQNKGVRRIETTTLKKMLCIEKNYRMNMFKRRVIDQAIQEINANTDLLLSYTEKKYGRSVKWFDFEIKPQTPLDGKNKNIAQLEMPLFSHEISEKHELRSTLEKIEMPFEEIEKIITLDINHLKANIAHSLQFFDGNKGKPQWVFTRECVKKDYAGIKKKEKLAEEKTKQAQNIKTELLLLLNTWSIKLKNGEYLPDKILREIENNGLKFPFPLEIDTEKSRENNEFLYKKL